MLDKKLQLKAGQKIAITGHIQDFPGIAASKTDTAKADAILVFVKKLSELKTHLKTLLKAGTQEKLVWIAYPKALQLDTDLNRDIVREVCEENNLTTVRQIALDDVWSALRVKSGM